MEIKKSKYNLFVPYGERTIVYNMMSGNIGTFDKSTMMNYENNTLSDNEVEKLIKKQILVPLDYDETNKINQDRIDSITKSNFKNFRIYQLQVVMRAVIIALKKEFHLSL